MEKIAWNSINKNKIDYNNRKIKRTSTLLPWYIYLIYQIKSKIWKQIFSVVRCNKKSCVKALENIRYMRPNMLLRGIDCYLFLSPKFSTACSFWCVSSGLYCSLKRLICSSLAFKLIYIGPPIVEKYEYCLLCIRSGRFTRAL